MAGTSDLELVVKLTDQASKPLTAVADSVKKVGTATAEQAAAIKRHSQESAKSFASLQKQVDEAGKAVKKVTNETEKAGKAAEKSAKSFNSLASSVIKGGLALAGIQMGLSQVNKFLNDSKDQYLAYQNSVNGTISLVRAFGLSEDTLGNSLKQVTADGLLSQVDAMKAMQNLLASGLSIEDATKLIGQYKDMAAFGRDNSISFGDAVSGLAESFMTEQSVLGNQRGLQENYNQIIEIGAQKLGKKVSALNGAERAQAKLIGTELIAQRATGNSTKLAESDAGAIAKNATAVQTLQQQVGAALTPAIAQLSKAFTANSTAGGAMTYVIRGLGVILVALAGAIRIVTTQVAQNAAKLVQWGKDVANSFKTGKLAFEKSSELAAKNGDEMKKIFEDVGKSIEEVWSGKIPDAVGGMVRANTDYMNQMADSAKKILEDIAKENERFARETIQVQKQFEESLKDMVLAHREKVSEIKAGIDEENTKFNEDQAEQKKKFDKSMADMIRGHQKKVDQITAQINKEKDKNKEAIDKITADYDLMLRDVKKNGDNRIAFLQSQLDKESDRQSSANKEKIEMLRRMIAEEKVAVTQSNNDVLKLREEEIEKETRGSQEKVADLNDDLAEQNQEFKEATEERKATYADETAQMQKEHEKRLASSRKELEDEMAIQRAHAADFARFENAVAEDDIARLQRKNAEERAENERAHQEKLQDIQRQVGEERATRDAGQVRSGGSNVQTQVQSTANKAATTSASLSSFQASTLSSITPAKLTGNLSNISAPNLPSTSKTNVLSSITTGAKNAINTVTSAVKKLFGFKTGGSFTVGGSGAADSQLVSFRASPGEKVSISTPEQQHGGNTINMPVTVMSNEMDMDRLVERLAWKLNKSGIGR